MTAIAQLLSVKVKLILGLLTIVIFVSACAHKPDFSITDTLGKSEMQLEKLDIVKETSSSFDGKNNIKFRLMVDGYPSRDEAKKLFSETLQTIATNSGHHDFWNNYNAQLDIKSYDKGILYTATQSYRK